MSLSLSGVTLSGRSLLTPVSSEPTDPFFSNVTLLLHADGINGATSTVDSSGTPKTITMNDTVLAATGLTGNSTASLSTSVFKFGTSSFKLNTSGVAADRRDYVKVATPAVAASGQHTVEAWIYTIYNGAASQEIYTQYSSGSGTGRYAFAIAGSTNRLNVNLGNITSTTSLAINTWYHVATTRDASNIVRLFINGNLEATSAATSAVVEQTAPTIGLFNNSSNSGNPFRGYIDDLRVTSGVCRYTSSFTPPTAAFPNS